MARQARSIVGGYVYHVLNRASPRRTLFRKPADYTVFEKVLEEAHAREPLRILAYCLMPNHWHIVVQPKRGAHEQVSDFFRWVTATHTLRWQAHRRTSSTAGHLYQGRFKSFPVASDEHLYTVLRYVEGNPLRAKLVDWTKLIGRVGAWRWSSLWRYYQGEEQAGRLLADWPINRPRDWRRRVSRALTKAELEAMRQCVQRSRPYGGEAWCDRIVRRLGLEWTIRPRGRPRNTD